jgi:hypothetical protein
MIGPLAQSQEASLLEKTATILTASIAIGRAALLAQIEPLSFDFDEQAK